MIIITGCSPDVAAAGLTNTSPNIPAKAEKTAATLPPIQPTNTLEPTLTLRPSATPLPTNTAIPSLTPDPTPTPIPDEYYITGIQGHRQTYAISCESSAAADWAGFFGVLVYEANIQFNLPISDNPDKGFVGDVHDPWGQVPPYSYGVHAEPIAKVLKDEYELPAQAAKNFSLDSLKEEIASNQPVIAWVIGNMVGGIPAEYTDKEGNTTIVAAYEHTVIVTGYNQENIRYMNNGRFYEIPIEVFLNSWGVLQNMVVYYKD
ncbi:MAG: hypothetical protein CL609_05815 [Anaerolineaceae bacterium]|nr:hypothetical protein [Anaerolineaceae bacterium]